MMMMQVLMAVGVCAAITLGLTVFAFQTKIDFTAMGGETQDCHVKQFTFNENKTLCKALKCPLQIATSAYLFIIEESYF